MTLDELNEVYRQCIDEGVDTLDVFFSYFEDLEYSDNLFRGSAHENLLEVWNKLFVIPLLEHKVELGSPICNLLDAYGGERETRILHFLDELLDVPMGTFENICNLAYEEREKGNLDRKLSIGGFSQFLHKAATQKLDVSRYELYMLCDESGFSQITLRQMKAQWQAEALDEYASNMPGGESQHWRRIKEAAAELHRQAEGDAQ